MEIWWDGLDSQLWQAAMPGGAAALQQSWRYGAAAAALGRTVRHAEIRSGGRLIGLAQVLVRKAFGLRVAFIPRGPVWIDAPPAAAAEALKALRRSLQRQGPCLLIAACDARVPGHVPLVSPATMAETDLTAGPEALRRGLHGKWRNRLTAAERTGIDVSRSDPGPADLQVLFQRDAAQQRARGYRTLPPAFVSAWIGAGPGGARLYAARARGETIAEMLFLDHAPGATYQIGWTSRAGRAASAHHLLLFRAMQDFAAAGRSRLDLGMIDTVNAPGLARFKLGTGARARRLGPTGLVLPGWTDGPAGWKRVGGTGARTRTGIPG